MKRSRLQKAGWSFLLLLSMLGCIELGVRILIGAPSISAIRLTYDEQLLWGLSEDQLNNPQYQINSLGLRGPEVQEDSRPRLLSLGDSSVFGDRVSYEETFTTVATQILAKEGQSIQPVIGAIPGYSSFQAVRQLERLGGLKPKFVLIGTLWSDAIQINGESDLEVQERLAKSLVVRLHLAAPLDAATRVSAAVARLRMFLKPGEGQIGWISSGARAPKPGLHSRVPLENYKENLETLVQMARDLGAEPIFLMLPHPIEDQGEQLAEVYTQYRNAMREAAKNQNLPLIDGPRYFAEHPCGGCTRFADNIHPNAIGHALLGEALADTLRAWK
jgi:lysophospholipase L1-like esterase